MNEERKEALIRKYTYAAKQAEAQGRGPGRGGPGTRDVYKRQGRISSTGFCGDTH